jgi:hypothetical protein
MHNLKLTYKGHQMACLTSEDKFLKSVKLLIEAAMLTDEKTSGNPEVMQLVIKEGYLEYHLKFPNNFFMYIEYKGDMTADQLLNKTMDL